MAQDYYIMMKSVWVLSLLIFASGFCRSTAAEPTNSYYNSQSSHCEARSGGVQPQQPQEVRRFSQPQVVPVQALAVYPTTANAVTNEIMPVPSPVRGGEPPPGPPARFIPLTLQSALEWTLSCNPDLVAIRQNLNVSADALAVARQFPTSLNPTVSVDLRPWVFERGTDQKIDQLATQVSVSWMQPIEFGHRTAYRTSIASAAYSQTRWTIL